MWWLHNIVNALNATELYIFKWLFLCYVNFTSIKIKPGGYSPWGLKELDMAEHTHKK